MDGTFRVCKKPFVQLYSVHAFIRCDDNFKQVPLAFLLMTGRRKRDYKAVLRALKERLPANLPLQRVVFDFEAAAWKAVALVFPGVLLQGCNFHWRQAVWRKTACNFVLIFTDTGVGPENAVHCRPRDQTVHPTTDGVAHGPSENHRTTVSDPQTGGKYTATGGLMRVRADHLAYQPTVATRDLVQLQGGSPNKQ
ncbi:hypothetical protein GQR58_024951 [Nymphon striatum]|nr:hypothetical protein GQR58_024951 [Nymphon striatum]